jgi:hypothetical protein
MRRDLVFNAGGAEDSGIAEFDEAGTGCMLTVSAGDLHVPHLVGSPVAGAEKDFRSGETLIP